VVRHAPTRALYLDPLDDVGYAVRGSVIIGRGNPYEHEETAGHSGWPPLAMAAPWHEVPIIDENER
jgi:hypothetical protein